MKITIEVEDDWLDRVDRAIGDDGSNDDEHDLLLSITEDVRRAAPLHEYEVAETCTYRVSAASQEGAIMAVRDALPGPVEDSGVTFCEVTERSANRVIPPSEHYRSIN